MTDEDRTFQEGGLDLHRRRDGGVWRGCRPPQNGGVEERTGVRTGVRGIGETAKKEVSELVVD